MHANVMQEKHKLMAFFTFSSFTNNQINLKQYSKYTIHLLTFP